MEQCRRRVWPRAAGAQSTGLSHERLERADENSLVCRLNGGSTDCGAVPTESLAQMQQPGAQTPRGLHPRWSSADGESVPEQRAHNPRACPTSVHSALTTTAWCADSTGAPPNMEQCRRRVWPRAEGAQSAGLSHERPEPAVPANSRSAGFTQCSLHPWSEAVAYALLDLCTGYDIRMHRKRQRLTPPQSFSGTFSRFIQSRFLL